MIDRERIKHAMYMLRGDTRVWWNLAKTLADKEYKSIDMIFIIVKEFIELT